VSAARLDRLTARLDDLGAEAFLVSNPTNVRYLTGFQSSNAYLLVGRERAIVSTDFRYLGAARGLADVEVLESERDMATWIAPRLAELAGGPVAFEADSLTVASHHALSSGGAELVPSTGVVTAIRAVKDPAELDAIRAAAAVLSSAYDALADHGLVGHTELGLVWFLERTMREAGAEAAAFDAIVGGGANGAVPHHHPGGRRIEPSELVVVDAGARVDGYQSDCTRTFATGALPEELERAYAATKEAQAVGLGAVRAGLNGKDAHEAAAQVIRDAGFGELAHGLGHGVGLDVHELPVLREGVDMTLEPRNVVTVEPGIYLADRGGVRIEDLVIVTDGEPEILTPFTKDLVTLA
jgi:Xaa-Pro aminopeptidase